MGQAQNTPKAPTGTSYLQRRSRHFLVRIWARLRADQQVVSGQVAAKAWKGAISAHGLKS
jgi:hypothetical protein